MTALHLRNNFINYSTHPIFNIFNSKYMKQKELVILPFFLFLFFNCFAQLDKGIWLVGGTGNFLASNYNYNSNVANFKEKKLNFSISPQVGYFVIDKLGLGLKTSFIKAKSKSNAAGTIFSNENRFGFGPFAKYYFLKKDLSYNFLSEINYQYGLTNLSSTKGNFNTFSVEIGPVIYFNTSVGLEFLFGYYNTKETINYSVDKIITKQAGFQMGIGFQIYLENLN